MSTRTNYKIALTHLTSRVKQILVAMLSVTFGASMYVFMNSFMSGVNDTQTEMAFSTLAHIRIYKDLPPDDTNILKKIVTDNQVVNLRSPRIIQYTEGIDHAGEVMAFLEKQEEITAVAPQVNINVFFRNGPTKVNGQLSGIDVTSEEKLFKTSTYLKEGDWAALQYRSDGIILGIGLARKLSLKLGDSVVVTTGDGLTRTYKVIGIIETTLAGVDNAKAYIKISAARQLLSKNPDYVTDIQVNLEDYTRARQVGDRLGRVLPYKVEAWQVANGQLEAANQLRDIIAVAVSLTILLVAGFGIYNIMNMTVNEKIREIAILKAMGFNSKDIVQIFLTQSVIIGFFGGLIGLGFGYIVARAVNNVPFQIATLETLPMSFRIQDYVMAFAFGLITTFIAGYLPSRKAAGVDPVSIIRG